jgi:anti-sigma factor RsiW
VGVATCPSRAELLAYHLGEVPGDDIDRLTAHLEACPDCDAAIADIERQTDPILAALRNTSQFRPDPTPPPAARPPVPARVGPFRVGDRIGAGGMGVVHRAEDETLGRAVALKLLKPDLAHDPTVRQRFLGEARATARVRHPNVVDIFQVGVDGETTFLAMELLAGESLEKHLRRSAPLPAAEAVAIARQIALGLAAAHATGLVHRDVKPDNVFLTPDGRVKLLDFGLARAVDSDAGLTGTGVIVGTPAYMAPEQARGWPVTDRTDLFALGCVLYRMCTGDPPFRGETAYAVLTALAAVEPPPPRRVNPAVPPVLDALIRRLLQKAPPGRPPSAAAVAEALDAMESGVPPAPGSFAAELIREAAGNGRRRARRAAVVAGVVLAGVVAAWPAYRAGRPAPLDLRVTSLLDEPAPGRVTLRDALDRANAAGGPAVVTLADAGAVELRGPLPAVTADGVEVRGPGADKLTVRPAKGAGKMGVFAVAPGGALTLSGLTMAGGWAGRGGGVRNDGGSLAIDRCVVADNTADEWGGGVYSSGPLRVRDSTVCRNVARHHGGGVYAGSGDDEVGGVLIANSTVSGNRAQSFGGGVVFHRTAGGRVDRATVAFNRCNLEGSGTASKGGGLRLLHGTATMTSTIVAHNARGEGPDDADDVSVSSGADTQLGGSFNVFGTVRDDPAVASGMRRSRWGGAGKPFDPRLGPLVDNLGPTPTHALLPDSPAIDAGGDADPPPFDQRGLPRTVGRRPDIGAYEFQTGPAVVPD